MRWTRKTKRGREDVLTRAEAENLAKCGLVKIVGTAETVIPVAVAIVGEVNDAAMGSGDALSPDEDGP